MNGYEQIQSGAAAACTIAVAVAGLLICIPVVIKAGHLQNSEKMLEFREGCMRSFFGGSVVYGFMGTFALICLATLTCMISVVAIKQQPLHGNRYADWGMPSSIAFCEADFAHSTLVAEPTNALTSLLSFVPISLIGLVGLAHEAPHGELRFVIMYIALGAIGLGSTLLHSTLRASTQAADELPMLWGCAILSFHFMDDFMATRRAENFRPYLPAASCGIVLLQTVGYYFAHEVFLVFALVCLVVVFASFVYLGSHAWRVLNSPATNSPEDLAGKYVIVPMAVSGGVSGVICLTCWALEMFGCVSVVEDHLLGSTLAPFLWQYLLHPIWHILGCFAVWAEGQILLVLWGLRMGLKRPCIIWIGVPVVVYRSKSM